MHLQYSNIYCVIALNFVRWFVVIVNLKDDDDKSPADVMSPSDEMLKSLTDVNTNSTDEEKLLQNAATSAAIRQSFSSEFNCDDRLA